MKVSGEDVVEQRAGPPVADALHDLRPRHAELVQDRAGHQRGAVVSHAAVRQHAVPGADERRAERAEGLEPRQRRQLLVVDREVDIDAAVRRGGNALVEPPLHVEHGVDAEGGDGIPLADGGGDIELSVIVDLVKRGCQQIGRSLNGLLHGCELRVASCACRLLLAPPVNSLQCPP